MPLISSKPSAERSRSFEAGIRHLVRLGRIPAGLAIDPNPQPTYVLSLRDLLADAHLSASARLVSWRYFAGGGPAETVTGHVSAKSPAAVVGLHYGDTARKALAAVHALDSLPEVHANEFVLRVLNIPGVLVEALWLKPSSDDDGLIVPYGRVFCANHLAGKPRPIDGFLKNTLRPAAEQVLRTKDSPATANERPA